MTKWALGITRWRRGDKDGPKNVNSSSVSFRAVVRAIPRPLWVSAQSSVCPKIDMFDECPGATFFSG